MQITLYRRPGSFGRAMALDIFVNASKVATIASGETKCIEISAPALMHIEMERAGSSQQYRITEDDNHCRFHCGSRFWVMLDLFDFVYLPVLNSHVFFLRRQKATADV